MQQSTGYHYSFPQGQRSPNATPPRPQGAYQNSSAFSASANPDEDWTKISDLAERRRIQNRIAQRNYRKKLKRRLEDLEKRTTTSSASPEQRPSEVVKSSPRALALPSNPQLQRRTSTSSVISHDSQYSPDIFPTESAWPSQRPVSGTNFSYSAVAPSYGYPNYTTSASSSDYFANQYPAADYPQIPEFYNQQAMPQSYLQQASPPLPSMSSYETYKTEAQPFATTDVLAPFNMNYASMAGINIPASQASSDYPLRCHRTYASFCGHLDTKVLGGAGFASQRTTDDEHAWDLGHMDGLQLTFETSKSDSKWYTFIVKDEILPPNPGNGREQSTISWEFNFQVPSASSDKQASVYIPWDKLQATYRGKKKKSSDPLDIKKIRRMSIMMRSFFGTQEGDFRLDIVEIAAWKKPKTGVSAESDRSSIASSSSSSSSAGDGKDTDSSKSVSMWARILSNCCRL